MPWSRRSVTQRKNDGVDQRCEAGIYRNLTLPAATSIFIVYTIIIRAAKTAIMAAVTMFSSFLFNPACHINVIGDLGS